MKTRTGISTRQQIVAAAFLALLSVHCGDDSSDQPAAPADGGPAKSSDAGAGSKLDGSTAPSIDAATKDTGVPVPNPGDASSAAHADAATSPGVDAAVQADSGTTVVDSGTPPDTIETFNGCASASYTDLSAVGASRVIAFGGASGLKYVPPCIIIAKGQKVTWNGAFGAHPLAPGISGNAAAGSANSPIKSTTTGNTAEFTFDAVGTFPYICTVHVGSGMAGSIHVK